MIQLLFWLLAAEVAMVFVLLFNTPLRKLAIMGLDRLKRGRGPVMVRTVAGTLVVVLSSSLYSMASIRSRSEEGAVGLNPTDQVLMTLHMLESSLMGYLLLLALIIDRLHHYIRELRSLRKSMEAVMKTNRALEESKGGGSGGGSDDIKAKDKEIASLSEQMKALKSESEAKVKDSKAAEYERLLEENQSLRSQLQMSHSDP